MRTPDGVRASRRQAHQRWTITRAHEAKWRYVEEEARALLGGDHRRGVTRSRPSYGPRVIDPERFTELGAEEMEAVGMGAVYTATHDGKRLRHDDPRHRADLLAAYFTPYAEALADLVDQRLAARDRAVIVDVHSSPQRPFPYERHSDLRPPEICLGVDESRASASTFLRIRCGSPSARGVLTS